MVTTTLVKAERRAHFVSLITPYLEIDVNSGEKVILFILKNLVNPVKDLLEQQLFLGLIGRR